MATYQAVYALRSVRSPLMMGGELDKAEAKLKDAQGFDAQPRDRQERLKTAQVYIDRLNGVRDERAKLIDVMPIARALWGKDLEKSIADLIQKFWHVECFAMELVDTEDRDRAIELRRFLNTHDEEKGQDDLSKDIVRLVGEIDKHCLTVLSPEDQPVVAVETRTT